MTKKLVACVSARCLALGLYRRLVEYVYELFGTRGSCLGRRLIAYTLFGAKPTTALMMDQSEPTGAYTMLVGHGGGISTNWIQSTGSPDKSGKDGHC
ncbi:MAG: hypothetical protein ACK42H_01400 [Planctomycetota bacterium]